MKPAVSSPAFVFTARHSPFELVILLVSLLTGVINLAGASTSPSLASVASAIPFYVPVWAAGLVLGSSTALVSAFLAIPTSLVLERIGLSLLATLFTSYAAAIVIAAGTRGFGTALLIGCFAFGSVLRIHQINRDIKLIGRAAAP